ncbi:MAG: DUF4091 domain-containing protein [Candidatus Latescibacterota bacterium]
MKLGIGCMLAALAMAFISADAYAQGTVKLAAAGSMERIAQDRPFTGASAANIRAARNEVESFQVVVTAGNGNVRVVSAEMSDLAGPGGARIGKDAAILFREEYVRVRRSTPRAELPPGLYPDPLVPFINPVTGKPIEPKRQVREVWGGPIVTSGFEMYAIPFDVFRGQNQPLWVDIRVPADAAPGTYKGTFTVTAADSSRTGMPVSLTVWDFVLPDGPTHHNHFGSMRNITRFFGVQFETERYNAIEMEYCRMLAEHRINPPLPRRLLPTVNEDGFLKIDPVRTRELKAFIDTHHVTDFEIPRAPYRDPTGKDREKTERYVRDYLAYLKENGWDKGAYYYMHDEPNLAENYQLVGDYGAIVHQAAPGLKCLVVEQTYTQDPTWPDIDPAVDIWCPLFGFIDRGTTRQAIARGDEVWSYTALAQRAPRYHPQYDKVKGLDCPDWHIDNPLTSYRVPAWINRQYGISGLLYWSVVTEVMDPWNNPAFSHFGTHFNGGGYLMYPGIPCGIEGPASCIRLKALRDGMEDYEYFVILERLAGPEEVVRIVNTVAPEWWNCTKDPKVISAARDRLAQEIMKRKGR